jgi:hypothetical protein
MMSFKTLIESLQSLVVNHYMVVQSLVSITSIIFIGIYINIVTNKLAEQPFGQVLNIILNLGFSNIFLLIGFTATLLSVYIASFPPTLLNKIGRKLIDDILEAACKSLTSQNNNANVRAIVMLIDNSTKTRTTYFSYNTRPDPERNATLEVKFGVMGKSLIERRVIFQELPSDHIDTYPSEIRSLILPDLKWVLSAPIYLPEKQKAGPIGVLAFDGTDLPSVIGLDNRHVMDVSQAWADIIGEILGQINVVKSNHHSE